MAKIDYESSSDNKGDLKLGTFMPDVNTDRDLTDHHVEKFKAEFDNIQGKIIEMQVTNKASRDELENFSEDKSLNN